MNQKGLIIILIFIMFTISSSLFFYINPENANKIGINIVPKPNNVPEKLEVIQHKDNAKTTISAATKEEIIEDFMQTKLLTYEEAEELHKIEQRINRSGYDEELRTAILQKNYYYDSIGIRFNAAIKYVYSLAENKPISIDYIGNVYTDTVGKVKIVRFLSMEDPIMDYNYNQLKITHFGMPIIEVDSNIADILINKYNFEFIRDSSIYTKILKPEHPLPLTIKITLEELLRIN